MSSAWGQGYVTDIDYDPGVYREQMPTQLKLACLLSGVHWDVPDEGAHYVELGCGQGIGALVVAASNPSWRVTALDFAPGHIAGARALAREAGIANVTFLEADLATFAESPAAAALPEADIVTAHGVWSWVGEPVKQGIVRLLRSKLRAGGVAHVSYNALPGWQGMLLVQRLVREAGLRLAGRSDRQAAAGLSLVRDLLGAEAGGLLSDKRIAAWLPEAAKLSATYLAHEFMNGHWAPCWQAEVASDLAAAQLDFVGTSTLLENFPELAMTGPQRAVYERFDDPLMRELVKESCNPRTLRHDLYVRGARRMSAAQRDAALRGLWLALLTTPDRVRLEVDVAAGKAEMARAFYEPVVRMMGDGPAQVADLLHAPGAVSERENPAELAGLMVGTRQAMVIARPGAAPDATVLRLNALLARHFGVTAMLNRGQSMASIAAGGGVPMTTAELFVAGRALAGAADERIEGWTEALAGPLEPSDQEKVAAALAEARADTPARLRRLGALPS
ncbi:class I SAM-dependent methyltransferase [Falsiroseomonas oryziterrae]|uniref:class I SAM-dependent methyltransferase n=1 Tax=Falsiroseomonas oryziterrae TaxID=2911368 RepID=UPI001F256F98|nr:class I SAM-dependent methyltransferase [Roseomonas sp. NPKOSM-4]